MSGAWSQWKLSHTHGRSQVFPVTKGYTKQLAGPFLTTCPKRLHSRSDQRRPPLLAILGHSVPLLWREPFLHPQGSDQAPPFPQQQATHRGFSKRGSLLTLTCPNNFTSLVKG